MPKVSNAIGEFINNVSGQTAAMNKQFEQNVEIAKNQYQWAVEDMKKAGLNPAMMFGGGSGHTATASTSIGGGQNVFANTASVINATANLTKSFNFDKDKKNNANTAQIINLVGKILN